MNKPGSPPPLPAWRSPARAPDPGPLPPSVPNPAVQLPEPTIPIATSRRALVFLSALLAAVLVAGVVAGLALWPRWKRRGDGISAVTSPSAFGLAVLVEHDGRALALAAHSTFENSPEGSAFVFDAVGDQRLAVGFAGRVVAADREAAIVVLQLQGVEGDELVLLDLADDTLAPGEVVWIAASHARYADELTASRRGAQAVGGIQRVKATVSASADGGGVWIAPEELGGRGFIGAPVFREADGRAVVGLAVRSHPQKGLLVTPAAAIRKLLDKLSPESFGEPDLATVEKALNGELRELSGALKAVDEAWKKVSVPRLLDDPQPDPLRDLSAMSLPEVASHLAPSDLARLGPEADRLARALSPEAHVQGAQAVTISPEQMLRALGFTWLRYLLGVAEKDEQAPRILSLARGALPGTYQVRIVDSYGEAHEICALGEHGRIFPSVYRCPTTNAERGHSERYAWFADRELGDRLRGRWVLKSHIVYGSDARPCEGSFAGSCLLEGSELLIDAVRGHAVRGRLKVVHRAHIQGQARMVYSEYAGEDVSFIPNDQCSVSLEELVAGTLLDGKGRLLGSNVENLGVTAVQNKIAVDDQKQKQDVCRKVARQFSGGVPSMGPSDESTIDPGNAIVDLSIDGVEADKLRATLFWRGSLRPWGAPDRPWVFTLVWAGTG